MYNCNRLFKAADHRTTWEHVHYCTVYSGESTWAAVIVAAYTVLYINIFTWKGFEECVREKTDHGIL